MTTTTLNVKNGTIRLPKKIREAWKDSSVFVRMSSDTLVLKKVKTDSFWKSWAQMRSQTKNISKIDTEKALARVRRVQRKK